MKLRELRHGPRAAWPPTFGGLDGAESNQIPVGAVGRLKAVHRKYGMPGFYVEVEYEGHSWIGKLQWDGQPSVKRMIQVLEQHVGEQLGRCLTSRWDERRGSATAGRLTLKTAAAGPWMRSEQAQTSA